MELERGAGNGWVEMFSQSSLELFLKVALESPTRRASAKAVVQK